MSNLKSELRGSLLAQISYIRAALFFGFFTSMLVVTPTLYMLQVYDRVINSQSLTTLAMLTGLLLFLIGVMEVLEWVRHGILHIAATRFDALVSKRVFDCAFEANLKRMPGASSQPFNDLRVVRDFVSSNTMKVLLDVPFALLFLPAVFYINPYLGCMALVGALVQVGLAALTERATAPPLRAANGASIEAMQFTQKALRNAQVIQAMGMLGNIRQRWMKKQAQSLVLQAQASESAAHYSSLGKFVQMAQSSLVLGVGCLLTINGLFPGGAGLIVVASILGGRVMAPILQLIGLWKNVVAARDAYARLDRLLTAFPEAPAGMALPPPLGQLAVEGVTCTAPNSAVPIIRNVSFVLPAGKLLALIGPSGSGKTTLARLLVGLWPAQAGHVRLDGADVYRWNKAELGPHLGYLSQDVELFGGTLADNIARFGEVDRAHVQAAAQAVGLHESIEALPQGYDTLIGEGGSFLSGGMRQRVGLARALYGNPRLVVLDEPNSSLDVEGEAALIKTILALRASGSTIVLISHRANILEIADLMLVLVDGQLKAYGPRDQIMDSLRPKASAPAPVPAAAVVPA